MLAEHASMIRQPKRRELDIDLLTCEGDYGYGPCGSYVDWGDGRCSHGHEIEIKIETEPA